MQRFQKISIPQNIAKTPIDVIFCWIHTRCRVAAEVMFTKKLREVMFAKLAMIVPFGVWR